MSVTTDVHQERATQLLALLKRYNNVLEVLHMDAELKEAQLVIENLVKQGFRILVIGEFNRGKSTLINALFGEKVLPAYYVETTAIINEIKWDTYKHATLYQGTKKIEIAVGELERYVTVPRGKNAPSNPYDKVELFWPLELCKNGVEIIDSPGLNVKNKERLTQTYNYLSSADAVIHVSDATVAGAGSEIHTIEMLQDTGHKSILFVCNKINLVPLDQQHLVKEVFIDTFAPYTQGGAKYIFFLNAQGALEGRITQDESVVRKSEILQFEEALTDFLVNERGRIRGCM